MLTINKIMKKDFLQTIKIIILGSLLSAGLSVAAGSWNPAPSPILSSNPDMPIYVSSPNPQSQGQAKGGGLLPANDPSGLYINGLLSANILGIFGNASIPGNGTPTNGTLQVPSLNQANNPTISTWPAPVCNDTAGKLIL